MAVFDDVEAGADKLRLYRHVVGWDGDIPAVDKAEAEPIPYGDEEPLAQECAHFLAAISDGTPPLSNAAEGRRVLAVLAACERALTSGTATAPA
jgi:UDP-2-acetamido-3-amino-2,3-dideoxy-glucuronate N-acetyltransferase